MYTNMKWFTGFLPSAELLHVNDTLPSTFHSQMLVIFPLKHGTTHANPTAKLSQNNIPSSNKKGQKGAY